MNIVEWHDFGMTVLVALGSGLGLLSLVAYIFDRRSRAKDNEPRPMARRL